MLKKLIIAFLFLAAIHTSSFATSFSDSTITIKVKGVTCSNDLKTLSDNVMQLKGVSACKPGKAGPVSVFKVTFNPALVGTKEIFKAIESTAGCSDPEERPYKVKAS